MSTQATVAEGWRDIFYSDVAIFPVSNPKLLSHTHKYESRKGSSWKEKGRAGGQEKFTGVNMRNIHKENGSLGLLMGKGKVRNLNRVGTRSPSVPFPFYHTPLS